MVHLSGRRAGRDLVRPIRRFAGRDVVRLISRLAGRRAVLRLIGRLVGVFGLSGRFVVRRAVLRPWRPARRST